MDYEYRNIDTDIELLKAAKLYWHESASTTEVYEILQQKLYTKWEADRAIADYYYVHIWSKLLLERFIIATSIVSIILLLLRAIYS